MNNFELINAKKVAIGRMRDLMITALKKNDSVLYNRYKKINQNLKEDLKVLEGK